MNLLLVTAMFALGAGEKGSPGMKLDGKWLIVYAEEGGRRNNAWEQRLATVHDGVLSYETEGGKKRSMKLHFGKHQTLKATAGEKTRSGVYILGQDYFTLSLDGGPAGGSSGDFILIMRRHRGKKTAP